MTTIALDDIGTSTTLESNKSPDGLIGINSIAFHVGDRSHTSAEHLWTKIPQAYRQHATFYTDQ